MALKAALTEETVELFKVKALAVAALVDIQALEEELVLLMVALLV
jgi:hypothetical protein